MMSARFGSVMTTPSGRGSITEDNIQKLISLVEATDLP